MNKDTFSITTGNYGLAQLTYITSRRIIAIMSDNGNCGAVPYNNFYAQFFSIVDGQAYGAGASITGVYYYTTF